MRSRALYPVVLVALVSTGNAYRLAPRVEQSLELRATYEGAWPLYLAGSCPQSYSVACGSKTDVNQICCPTGNTCHGSFDYCCPTAQDCGSFVDNFPSCVDPSTNMFAWGNGFFCCAQGQIGVYPGTGLPFCQSNDIAVPVSIQATMISQFGGTSVTPFGGFGTATPGATGTGTAAGAATSAGSPAATTASAPKSTTTTSSAAAASATASSTGFQFSTPVYVGIGVAAIFVIAFVYGMYKCCMRRMSSRSYKSSSYKAGPSVLSGYVSHGGYTPAPSQQMPYYPPPYQPGFQTAYDPVMERGTIPIVTPGSPAPTPGQTAPIISPMTPPPPARTPVPEYGFKDEPQERTGSPLNGGAGAMTSIEMMAMQDASHGRAEMPVVGGRGRAATGELPAGASGRDRTELPAVHAIHGRVELG